MSKDRHSIDALSDLYTINSLCPPFFCLWASSSFPSVHVGCLRKVETRKHAKSSIRSTVFRHQSPRKLQTKSSRSCTTRSKRNSKSVQASSPIYGQLQLWPSVHLSRVEYRSSVNSRALMVIDDLPLSMRLTYLVQ